MPSSSREHGVQITTYERHGGANQQWSLIQAGNLHDYKLGYCVDINECSIGQHECNENAICINSLGGYRCQCKPGFAGNGEQCNDIDECSTRQRACGKNTYCFNNAGSYKCRCKDGFEVGSNGHDCRKIRGVTNAALNNALNNALLNLLG